MESFVQDNPLTGVKQPVTNASQKPIQDGNFHRGLKNRHVQLIALGGIIGSCFFLGTGAIVASVGPAAFLAYIFGGIIVYLTMQCMGELAVAIPISGSFITYAADFISPDFACGAGWSYWITWIAYIPAECVAGGIIMENFTGINGYVWAVSFGLFVTLINLARVSAFGEIEFWLALIKIFALIGFVFLSVLIFFGDISNTHPSSVLGTKYLLGEGGLFPKGAMALLSSMVLLLVNYQGSEIIGLTAGESTNPAKIIPAAIRNVSFRILCLYIIPTFCLVLIFPWQKAGLSNSVFADALAFHGLRWAGSVISFVTLTAALSCANSGFYGTVRALHALSRDGMAPKGLSKLNKYAVPQNAVIMTLIGIWLLLGVGYFFGQSLLYVSLLLVSGFSGTICWIALCWAQINFRRRLYKAGYSVKDLLYKTPGSPYTALFAIVLMVACLCLLFFNKDPIYKIAFYIGCFCLIMPIIAYQFYKRTPAYKVRQTQKNRLTFEDVFPQKKAIKDSK